MSKQKSPLQRQKWGFNYRIADTNHPDDVDFIIPGNDDAIRSISLISRIISNACLEGSEMSEQ